MNRNLESSSASPRWAKWRRGFVLGMVLAVAAWAGVGGDHLPQEPQSAGREARVLRRILLRDTRIDESSGLVCSLSHPGLFWTHNDSLGAPQLFAVDAQGETRAVVRLLGASNVDWEDLATWRRADGRVMLMVADIGDNLRLRPGVDLYEVEEPALPKDAGRELLLEPKAQWRLVYPDGHHNAEALLVVPGTGRVMIITKDPSGHSGLYAIPNGAKAGGGSVRLERLGGLELPPWPRLGKSPRDAMAVTGAALSADGRRLAVATYSCLLEWELEGAGDVAAALRKPPRRLLPPLLRQLEAVAYSPEGNSVWISTEQLPTAFIEMDLGR